MTPLTEVRMERIVVSVRRGEECTITLQRMLCTTDYLQQAHENNRREVRGILYPTFPFVMGHVRIRWDDEVSMLRGNSHRAILVGSETMGWYIPEYSRQEA